MNKMRVFGHPWHLAHQYELAKFPEIEWHWLVQHRRQYGPMARGDFAEKYNIKWVTEYEPGVYDFALLHIDQQCFAPKLWEKGKGSLYRELNELIQDIPKIVIMHGTPYYPDMFPGMNEFDEPCDGISQELIDLMQKETKGNYVIVNSKTAAKQWGMGTPIWHGMDPKEWWDLPKEPRVVTMIGPGGLPKYYDRAFLQGVKEALGEEGIKHCHITVDWQAKNFDEYREFIGRSLLYFNPTKESPMPRARTEAMLSGCCVLTTPHQDADEFIEHGVNGYIVKRNPYEVTELVKRLFENYEKAIEIGQKGKETATKLFNHDRFHFEWINFIQKSIKDYKEKNV